MTIYKFAQADNKNFLKNKRLAIIVADFYKDISEQLLIAAEQTLKIYDISMDNIDVFYIPGAFEAPLMCEQLAQCSYYHAIITLGAVIKGETPHFDYICNEMAAGIAKASRQYHIPIAFGILTANNKAQALARSGGHKGNKGIDATLAAIEMIYLIEIIQKLNKRTNLNNV